MTTTTTTSVRWAWEKAIRDDGNLSRNAKLLGYTLGTFMDVRGRCRPGKAKLTEALCFTSHKSLEPCRSELRKAGYVTITRHIGRPTEYRATTPNPLGSGPAETQTKTSNIANLLSQPANERVSQPANERSRTDHKTRGTRVYDNLNVELSDGDHLVRGRSRKVSAAERAGILARITELVSPEHLAAAKSHGRGRPNRDVAESIAAVGTAVDTLVSEGYTQAAISQALNTTEVRISRWRTTN
jgi:hypothetical protein